MMGRLFVRVLLFGGLAWMASAPCLVAQKNEANSADKPSSSATQSQPLDLTGVWSGTFRSNSNLPPFTMTIVINRDSKGRLVGTSSLDSKCFKGSNLQVTVKGSHVVLAGSDADGDSITLRGTSDKTGTLLTLNYVANGSASANCESDMGTGNLGKR